MCIPSDVVSPSLLRICKSKIEAEQKTTNSISFIGSALKTKIKEKQMRESPSDKQLLMTVEFDE